MYGSRAEVVGIHVQISSLVLGSDTVRTSGSPRDGGWLSMGGGIHACSHIFTPGKRHERIKSPAVRQGRLLCTHM